MVKKFEPSAAAPARAFAPNSIRDVLPLFAMYDPVTGLEGLLDQVDLTACLPRQVYYAVHGRPPESIATALAERDHAIANIFAAALRSGEFRHYFVRNVLAAFPEKRRLLHIDIPNCGVPDLARHLSDHFAPLNTNLVDPNLVSDDEFFMAIKGFVLALPGADGIFVHGHTDLATYEAWNALRLNDSVFAILADPTDLALAQVNYVLARIADRQSPPGSDTLGWRQEFVAGPEDVVPGDPRTAALARRILAHRGVVPANCMTSYLGDGHAVSAVENIVTRHIELTNIANFSTWCRERWQIAVSPLAQPAGYFNRDKLTPADHELLEAMTGEDRQLYHLVADRLEEIGRPSLIGRDIILPTQAACISPGGRPSLLRAELTMPRNELLLGFESLGENCEFGLVQRRCGAEPLGLLRFSSSPLPKLLKALEARFDGMGMPANIEVQLSDNQREYMVLDKAFGFLYHAWVKAEEQTPHQVHQREVSRVPFLVRKLIEDLTGGEKTFVFHGMTALTEAQARHLHHALRQYGPARLLWVELATDAHPPGSVEWFDDGLYKGYIDRFAPGENAHDLSLDCWIDLCSRVHTHRTLI
jgi:hypothetical protein